MALRSRRRRLAKARRAKKRWVREVALPYLRTLEPLIAEMVNNANPLSEAFVTEHVVDNPRWVHLPRHPFGAYY